MPRASPRPTLLLPLAAATLLLALTTFFLGDTGVYSDDWFCNQRTPATGLAESLVMNRPWHPWRPLCRRIISPLVTLLWNHPWVLHAISAALHAIATALLYRLLLRLRVRASIACPVALLFMCFPAFFEVVLWSATIGTLLSIVVMLLIWHAYVRWTTASAEPSFPQYLRAAILFAFLTFASAALNEQAVGALLALPFVPLILAGPRDRTRAARVLRFSLPLLSVALAGAAYALGLLRHLQSTDARLSRDTTEGIAGLLHRASAIARALPGELTLRDLGSGAWHEGLAAIALHPWRIALLAIPLCTLAAWWIRSPQSATPVSSHQLPRRHLLTALLGLIWCVGGWLPVIASYSVTWPRLHYVPALGLAIAAAGSISYVFDRTKRDTTAKPSVLLQLARAAVAALLAVFVVQWIGLQSGFQRRSQADAAEAAPLTRLFAGPHDRALWLVPVHIASTLPPTGSTRYDAFFRHAWYWNFSAGWRAQYILRSTNVYTFTADTGVPLSLNPADPAHSGIIRAVSPRPKPPPAAQLLSGPTPGDRILPWDQAILFQTDSLGHTSIVTLLRMHPDNQPAIEVIPSPIKQSPAAAQLPPLVLDVYPPPHPIRAGSPTPKPPPPSPPQDH